MLQNWACTQFFNVFVLSRLILSAECQCNFDGTIDESFCRKDDGQCLCKPNWIGLKCESTGTSLPFIYVQKYAWFKW